MSVVGERDDARALRIEPMGASSSPARPLVIAPVGKNVDACFAACALFTDPRDDAGLSTAGEVFGMQTTVVNPPAAARARAGRDGFLRGLSRLAQVDVDVDQAGADDEPGGVDHFRVRRDVRAPSVEIDALNSSIGQINVADAVEAVRRIDDVAVGDERSFHAACASPPAHR